VLGTVNVAAWRFAAVGKHPAARDFLRVGSPSPLVEGLAAWVDAGYAGIGEKRRPAAETCSFRFWARGAAPGAVACGVVRDSADRVGRPYPLLLAGTGPLPGWEGRWDLLPYACLPVWERMEHIASRRYDGAAAVETAVGELVPPRPDWDGYARRRDEEAAILAPPGPAGPRGAAEKGGGDGTVFVELSGTGAAAEAAALCRRRLLGGEAEPPGAVFLGGTPARVVLGIFRRPLAAADFVRLWTAGGRRDPAEGGAD